MKQMETKRETGYELIPSNLKSKKLHDKAKEEYRERIRYSSLKLSVNNSRLSTWRLSEEIVLDLQPTNDEGDGGKETARKRDFKTNAIN